MRGAHCRTLIGGQLAATLLTVPILFALARAEGILAAAILVLAALWLPDTRRGTMVDEPLAQDWRARQDSNLQLQA